MRRPAGRWTGRGRIPTATENDDADGRRLGHLLDHRRHVDRDLPPDREAEAEHAMQNAPHVLWRRTEPLHAHVSRKATEAGRGEDDRGEEGGDVRLGKRPKRVRDEARRVEEHGRDRGVVYAERDGERALSGQELCVRVQCLFSACPVRLRHKEGLPGRLKHRSDMTHVAATSDAYSCRSATCTNSQSHDATQGPGRAGGSGAP